MLLIFDLQIGSVQDTRLMIGAGLILSNSILSHFKKQGVLFSTKQHRRITQSLEECSIDDMLCKHIMHICKHLLGIFTGI